MTYVLHLAIYIAIYSILALSLNLIVGYCGLLTMAHASYFAIGGYTYALLTLTLGWGFLPSTAGAMLVAAILSLALSLPAWRFRGDSFVLISLAIQALVFSILSNWYDAKFPIATWRNLANGPSGIPNIPKPDIIGIRFDTVSSMAILSLALLAICGVTLGLLKISPFGRLLKCMRDDELATRGLGKNVRLTKVYAFGISCSIAALAGVIYSSYTSYIDPSSASLDHSILMVSMVLIGGVGNFRGPIVGAIVLVLMPEILRFGNLPYATAANVRLLVYGVLIALMVHLRPQGLMGEYRFR